MDSDGMKRGSAMNLPAAAAAAKLGPLLAAEARQEDNCMLEVLCPVAGSGACPLLHASMACRTVSVPLQAVHC
jgi:hypothetical protein